MRIVIVAGNARPNTRKHDDRVNNSTAYGGAENAGPENQGPNNRA